MRSWTRKYLDSKDWEDPDHWEPTGPGQRFFEQHLGDLTYLTADRQVLEFLEETAELVDKSLSKGMASSLTPVKNRLEKSGLREGVLANADRVRGEVALIRYVDSYLTYLSELMREIFLARPETLNSNETLTVNEALAHYTMDELTAFIADRRVTKLSFQGLSELATYFGKALGLPLIEDEELRDYMHEWVAIRNLLTHRRGVVDHRAISGGLDPTIYKVGERVQLEPAHGYKVMAGVVIAALDLDRRASAKFALECKPFDSLSRR